MDGVNVSTGREGEGGQRCGQSHDSTQHLSGCLDSMAPHGMYRSFPPCVCWPQPPPLLGFTVQINDIDSGGGRRHRKLFSKFFPMLRYRFLTESLSDCADHFWRMTQQPQLAMIIILSSDTHICPHLPHFSRRDLWKKILYSICGEPRKWDTRLTTHTANKVNFWTGCHHLISQPMC